MPRGVYDRGKRKPALAEVVDGLNEKMRGIVESPPAPARRCDRCEAFEPENPRQGDCLLNPQPVSKYAHQWCLQWRAKG